MVAFTSQAVEAIKPRLLFATPKSEIDVVLELSPEEIRAKEACLRAHDALVTLVPDGDPSLLYRPPMERYSFLGDGDGEPRAELFSR